MFIIYQQNKIFYIYVAVVVQQTRQRVPNNLLPLRNNSNISIIPRNSPVPRGVTPMQKPLVRMLGPNRDKNWSGHKQPVAATRPYFGEGPTQSPVSVRGVFSIFFFSVCLLI